MPFSAFFRISSMRLALLFAILLIAPPPAYPSYSYARTAVSFDAASQPSTGLTFCDNSATVTFPTASGGNWGTITHISIKTSNTYGAGDTLFKGALTASKTVSDGDTFQVQAGNLVISLT